eukprot:4332532-Pyramimonas_sp.AAC.1
MPSCKKCCFQAGEVVFYYRRREDVQSWKTQASKASAKRNQPLNQDVCSTYAVKFSGPVFRDGNTSFAPTGPFGPWVWGLPALDLLFQGRQQRE